MDAGFWHQPDRRTIVWTVAESVNRYRVDGSHPTMGQKAFNSCWPVLTRLRFHSSRTTSIGLERWSRHCSVVCRFRHSRCSSLRAATLITRNLGSFWFISWSSINFPTRSRSRSFAGICLGVMEATTSHCAALGQWSHRRLDLIVDTSTAGWPKRDHSWNHS